MPLILLRAVAVALLAYGGADAADTDTYAYDIGPRMRWVRHPMTSRRAVLADEANGDADISSLAECVARAKQCTMANFVSFSKKNRDCSWYIACDIRKGIGNPTDDYESEVIKVTQGAPAVGTTSPVCCGDTSVGGDCNKDKSGSWSPPPPPARVRVAVDWNIVLRTVKTSSQIETDVMPFLARTPDGGNFNGYMNSLQNLGAEFMRFSPWFGYPQVVVPELIQTDCQGSQANYTLMDGIMRDFMTSVCGMKAADGECQHSVSQQLSTMPSWLYKGGANISDLPSDPWQYPSGDMAYYSTKGTQLVDESCAAMARYAARFTGWYTAGGYTDECGKFHKSGYYYNWTYLSVLNEDEKAMQPENGVEYTKCFDQWKAEIAKVNPHVTLIGPETYYMSGGKRNPGVTSLAYNTYFLNASNHADGQSPPVISNHNAVRDFDGFDQWFTEFAQPLEALRQALAPNTESVLNEVVLGVSDWCDPGQKHEKCPEWQDKESQGRAANRKTLSWNHDATVYAYNFARLSELGYLYVTSDQLVGGPWPDNYPSVSSLDWQTGEPNAKYWTVRLLASVFGKRTRQLVQTNISSSDGNSTASAATSAHAMGFLQQGQRGVLLLSKRDSPVEFSLPFASGWEGVLLEGVGDEPGFTPPRAIQLGEHTDVLAGAYAVLALWEPLK